MSNLAELRETLKWSLFEDPTRKVAINGQVWTCEGKAFDSLHVCTGGFHMHEAFWTRNHITKLPDKDKAYFFNQINCVLLCGSFHFSKGHTKQFRNWFAKIQLIRYGQKVIDWIEKAPTLIPPDFDFDLIEYLEAQNGLLG